ncbi:MAG: universal stress protein, partial [Gemmatimonadaceae bacterium]
MFRKVLVPLDRSPLAEQALDIAAEIAHASQASMDVVLVHQHPAVLGVKVDDRFNEELWSAEEKYLVAIVSELEKEQHVAASHDVPAGHPVERISARAQDIEADLIVMTTHGRTGVSRAWLGSVADGVVRQSRIPVLLLRPAEGELPRGNVRPLLKRILVPLDGSPLSTSILDVVSDLARCLKAQVVLLRIVPPIPFVVSEIMTGSTGVLPVEDEAATRLVAEEARRELAAAARRLTQQGCGDGEEHVILAPNVAQEIVDFARSHAVDLVAMSTHGRGVSRLVVGSVADKVLR